MGNDPLISILMTAYNRQKYIAEAIESVLASTYSNFELIIVDDFSNDNTLEIARSYEAKDKRIRVYVNEKNLGDYPNRNQAANYANGKYIQYIDSDDLLHYWGLQVEVDMMERFPNAAYGMAMRDEVESVFPILLSPKEAYENYYLKKLGGIFNGAPTSVIIRKEKFDFVNGFSNERQVGDYDLWHKLALHNSVLLLPGGFIWTRTHEGQEFKEFYINPMISFQYTMVSYRYLNHLDCPLLASECEKLKEIRLIYLAKQIIKHLIKGNFQLTTEMMNLAELSFQNVLRLMVKFFFSKL